MTGRRAALAALAMCAALALGGCARASGSPRQQMSGWASSTGVVGIDADVIGDVKGFEGALAVGKILTAKTVCDALYQDVSQAYVSLPSPDQQLTNLLNSAYQSLGDGANDCDSALGGAENRTLLAKAVREIDSGSASLTAADDRLASFGVSTTTGPTGASALGAG